MKNFFCYKGNLLSVSKVILFSFSTILALEFTPIFPAQAYPIFAQQNYPSPREVHHAGWRRQMCGFGLLGKWRVADVVARALAAHAGRAGGNATEVNARQIVYG